MRESLIGFSHPMHVLSLLDGRPGIVRCIQQLARELLRHAFPAAGLRKVGNPAQGQRRAAHRPDLDRHLVGRAADPAGFDLHHRLDVVDGGAEYFKWITAGFLLDRLERTVANPLRGALLAAGHQYVDEFPDQLVMVARIGKYLALTENSPSRHDVLTWLWR